MGKKILGILLCIAVCLGAPIIVEDIIVNGIFGYVIDTYLGSGEWFSFYGSYLGALITIVIFFLTLHNEKKQIINEIKSQKAKEKYSSAKEIAKEIVSLLALDKFYLDPCAEISFSALDILKNDIRRVKLLKVLVQDDVFQSKVNVCISDYEKIIEKEIDEDNITLTVLRPTVERLKKYYSESGIDEEYLALLNRIDAKEFQELTGVK